MENEPVSKFELSQAWKSVEENLVQSANLDPEMNEVDSSQDAINRRDAMEKMADTPSTINKTIVLDGKLADILDRELKQGTLEWTDGFSGNGPYLPKEVEDYILNTVGNETEEPFIVKFLKYGSASPLEGRHPPIYVEYEQGQPDTSNEFRR
jgi:hypothetical protein